MIRAHHDCVVVPVEFTADSFAAIDEALKHVDNPAHLQVVHVLPPVDPDEFESVWTPRDPASRIEEARRQLEQELGGKYPPGIEADVLLGDPATAIAQFVAEQQADLVVAATRGLTGFSRLLSGSVCEQLVRLCACPVLVLHPSQTPTSDVHAAVSARN